ncbi:RDD family protein [Effusibacillus consociatus]|uniref:RDD family protein n=1 Tax=Effusibacillus consociatus TaxID=1117041 RepID=A0ABV9Q2Y5_9BACL
MEPNEIVSEETRYAGFWIRFGANFLDFLVLTGFTILVYVLLDVDFMNPPLGVELTLNLINVLYFVGLTALYGQTLGKMAVGIRVIKQDGRKVSWGTALLREIIGKLVSAIILMIGYIMAAFDSKKRALHDRIADTYVVKVKR